MQRACQRLSFALQRLFAARRFASEANRLSRCILTRVCRDAGFQAHVSKPLDPETLVAIVRLDG